MVVKSNTAEFINKAKRIHGDKYNYSKANYKSSAMKVCIICPEHGVFMQTPNNHLAGKGCKKCASAKLSEKKSKSNEEFIEKANKIHANKYDYSRIEYKNSKTKVCITCPEHGDFFQTPNAHLAGQGCPYCGHIKTSYSKTKSTDKFIQEANIVHNGRFNYSKSNYKGTHEKICIICPKHGEFWQTPDNHLMGQGCPECTGNARSTTKRFIANSIKIHGDKYDYSKVTYINSKTKVEIICQKHGSFLQTPHSHLMGAGCPICGQIEREKNYVHSRIEKGLYLLCCEKFGQENVIAHYNDDQRYPYSSDIYIKSIDCFIELNAHWTHGKHWFDENNANDKNQLKEWIEKAGSSKFYKNAIETWTVRDVNKRKTAQRNNLNYIVLWDKNDIEN